MPIEDPTRETEWRMRRALECAIGREVLDGVKIDRATLEMMLGSVNPWRIEAALDINIVIRALELACSDGRGGEEGK